MGIFDCDCACAAPPNTQPVADASKEATQIMAQLGREQLAEARRQFDINRGVSDQVVKSQLGLVEQAKQQGDDYFNYGKSFRDLEQLMKDDVAKGTSSQNAAERDAIQGRQNKQANELLGIANTYSTGAKARSSQAEAVGLDNARVLREGANRFQSEQDLKNKQLGAITAENSRELEDRAKSFDQEMVGDIRLVTGGNSGIQSRYANEVEQDVGRALADTRRGQTSAINQAARQAARYGVSLPAGIDGVNAMNAAELAAAANNSRSEAIDRYRGLVRDGISMKSGNFGQVQTALSQAMDRQQGGVQQTIVNNLSNFQAAQNATAQAMDRQQGTLAERQNTDRQNFVTETAAKSDAFNRQNQADLTGRNQRIQDQSLDFARKLDVTGMARGLPGASQGAYQVSIGAGNSAVNNTAQAGNSYLAAINQGVGTIGRGQELNLQGQSNILNALTSYTNQVNQVGNNSYLGDVISAGGAFFGASDRDLKTDIKKVGKDKQTGLNEYEFKYKGGKTKYRGVMADEVEDVDPDAVKVMPSGHKAVNYAKLGIEFKEVK